MASIGGVTVYGIDGLPQMSGRQVASSQRPGVSGQDYHDMGIHADGPFSITVHNDYTSAANRATAMATFRAMRGSLLTLVDSSGITWTNLMCLSTQIVGQGNQDMGVARGGTNNGKYHLSVQFTLEAAATVY